MSKLIEFFGWTSIIIIISFLVLYILFSVLIQISNKRNKAHYRREFDRRV